MAAAARSTGEVMRPRTAAFDALVDTVSAEHDVVEYLLFKLVTLKQLFVADERRFVDPATVEVEQVVDRLRRAEQVRADALAAVAREWEVPVDELTLRRLAREAPGEHAREIERLHRSFVALADEIEGLLDDNRKLAATALTHLRTLLDSVADSTGTELYTDAGRRHRGAVRPVQLDRAL